MSLPTLGFRLNVKSQIFNLVNSGGVGKGGNIDISTGNLFATNSARIATNTIGRGSAGNIKITALNGKEF
jgi:large exoprotein involved in heme utilization and adhesion